MYLQGNKTTCKDIIQIFHISVCLPYQMHGFSPPYPILQASAVQVWYDSLDERSAHCKVSTHTHTHGKKQLYIHTQSRVEVMTSLSMLSCIIKTEAYRPCSRAHLWSDCLSHLPFLSSQACLGSLLSSILPKCVLQLHICKLTKEFHLVYLTSLLYFWLYYISYALCCRKVSGSIPSGVAGDFFWSYQWNHVPWGRLNL
jgi:hypothetical protein